MKRINKYLGGCFSYKEIDSCTASADLDPATSSADSKCSAWRKVGPTLEVNPGNSSKNDVLELLECPICRNLMYPPIYQCPNGHTLCSNCKARVKDWCPTCRHKLGNIRCLVLEKVAEPLELPCKYQIWGCQDILPYGSRLKHEKHCKYCPYNCPCGLDCRVSGDISFLVMHLEKDHKVVAKDGCTFEIIYTVLDPLKDGKAIRVWELNVFNCFGHLFCSHFEACTLGTEPVYVAFLRFVGDEDEAKQFGYKLKVGGNGKKLTWQGIPRSIRDSCQEVRDSRDGLIIPRNSALFFPGNNKKKLELKFAGRIWKEQ